MNLILQNVNHRAFIADETGSWTWLSQRAHVFAHGLEAFLFCFDRRLLNMQILVRFTDPTLNFAVPVPAVTVSSDEGFVIWKHNLSN